jgi:aspartyl-tRNA(Asn)/glutamyl-tRNA(Gln) amidotransferase subunit C
VPISLDEVRHVAALARLGLKEDELAGLAAELSRILDHVQRLAECDTAGVPPTAHVLALRGVTREDQVRPGLGREAALANAPAQLHGYFLVPRVVEEGEG